MLVSKYLDTPLGPMLAAATDHGVCVFDFQYRRMMDSILGRVQQALSMPLREGGHPHLDLLAKEVREYFAGSRQTFSVPLHLLGTPFQIRVWKGLQDIPYGHTRTYRAQSGFLGDEKAIRAVARANGANGLAILIPCHRVIGAQGSLVGYGGDLQRKQWLLEHERRHSGESLQQSLFMP